MKDMTRRNDGCLWIVVGLVALLMLAGGCFTLIGFADIYKHHAKTQRKTVESKETAPTNYNQYEEYEPSYPKIDSTREAFLDRKKWLMPHLKNRTARRIMQKIANSYKCSYYNDRWGIKVLSSMFQGW